MEGMGVTVGDWHGRRVLLTGHTGFKGAWLALWLKRAGAEVVGLSDAIPTAPSLYELANVSGDLVADLRVDVRDAAATAAAVAEHRPEVVLHLAAQPIVHTSFAAPVDTFAVNTMGTAHVLESCRTAPEPPRAVVVVTSDKCYENREWHWAYRENESMGGKDPYSASKGAAELVTASYRRSFFGGEAPTQVASARAGNVFGGGDWGACRLVPDVARAAAAGEPVQIRNPGATRPWQHVLNPLSGYLMLAERLLTDTVAARGWNFGPPEDDVRTVQWVVDHLANAWGEAFSWQRDTRRHPPEAGSLKVDSSDARALLGWRPTWDLEYGLAQTATWYRDVAADPSQARSLTLDQIEAFAADLETQGDVC